MKILIRSTFLFCCLVVVLLTTACKNDTPNNTPTLLSSEKTGLTFKEDQIFDNTIVDDALERSTEADETAAKEQLTAALALSDDQLDKKETALLKAILAYPTPEAYSELGKTHTAKGNYASASSAYDLALHLGTKTPADIYYAKACSQALNKEAKAATQSLELAFNNGFNKVESFLGDAALDNIRGTDDFMAIYDSNYTEEELPLFDMYVKSFEPQEIPLKIGAKELNNTKDLKLIAAHFEDFVPELKDALYDEGDTDDLFFYKNLGLAHNHHVLVYAGKPSYSVNPTYYLLASYNQEGRLMNKVLIAGKEKWSTVFYGKVDAGYKIYVSEMKVTLEDNEALPEDSPNNLIVGDEVKGIQSFAVNEKGKLEVSE